MGRVLLQTFKGLYTAPNAIGNVPEGAMLEAFNVAVRESGRLQPRRGFTAPITSAPTGNADFDRGFPYARGTGKHVLTLRDNLGSPSHVGMYDEVNQLMSTLPQSPGANGLVYPFGEVRSFTQAANSNGNLYLTTNAGTGVVDSVGAATARWRMAGLPQPDDPFVILGSSGSNRNIPTNTGRTYRITIGFYDQNFNYFESPPSGRVNLINTSGTPGWAQVYLNVPPGMPPGAFFRVWRTFSADATGLTDQSQLLTSDEMFLISEIPLGGFQTSTGTILYASPVNNTDGYVSGVNTGSAAADISIDQMLSIPLYTNPITGGGIGSANTRPPTIGSIVQYHNRMYGGRVAFPPSLTISIIGTDPAMEGLTITIDGIVYTFKAVPAGSNGNVGYFTTANIAANLSNTARNFVRAVAIQYGGVFGTTDSWSVNQNANAENALWATYSSTEGQTNDFGKFTISRVYGNGNPFVVQMSSGLGPFIRLGTKQGATLNLTVTSNVSPGLGLRSAVGNPEAWPLQNYSPGQSVPSTNYFPIGDPNAAILNIVNSRDTLFYEKEDGLFRVSDDGPNPTVTPVDPTAQLLAPDSVALVDNVGFGLFTQGYLSFTEQGTQPIVRPIEVELLSLVWSNRHVEDTAFGVPYQSEKFYICGRPSAFDESLCSYQDVYSTATGSWSRWDIYGLRYIWLSPDTDKLLGLVKDDRTLPLLPQRALLYERKGGFNSQDYEDPTLTLTSPFAVPTVVSALVLTGGDYRQAMKPGNILTQLSNGTNRVDATVTSSWWDGTNTYVNLDSTYTFNNSSILVRQAIQASWRLAPITGADPTMDKQWTEVQAYFALFDGPWMDVTLSTERSENTAPILTTIPQPPTNVVGSFAYGAGVRGMRGQSFVARTAPDPTCAMSVRIGALFQLPCCNGSFLLDAIGFDYAGTSETPTR